MVTRLSRWALEWAARLLRGFTLLTALVWLYELLSAKGIWYPQPVDGYFWVAVVCAVSIAIGRRFPLAQLIGVAAVVANPLWSFPLGQIRAIPLVLAAFFAADAGLSIATVLPVAGFAALASQFPGWIRVSPEQWPLWGREMGLSQPLMILGIVCAAALVGYSSYRQRRTAESLRAQNEELGRLRESDRERIANEERAAIAREVHDVVAHHVAAIVVRAQAAARVADRRPDEPRAAVEWIADSGPQALAEMRSLVRVLRDDSAGDGAPHGPATLADELTAVIERVRTAGLDVHARIEAPRGLSAVQEFSMLRVCQEALTNVLVHSPATSVEVRLFTAGSDAVLLVEDNGTLVAPTKSEGRSDASAGGSGLRGMRERAKAAGGFVSAGPSPVGWRVELVLPRGESVWPLDAQAAPA
ncbi:sensor histidine kinase [Gryllotalpicola daejeonensis]|uniref:sensor histidine kinase n=1 Tax=Gryllotalpicola daejeonensis TaxID=993087 RepID=UPI0031E26DB2